MCFTLLPPPGAVPSQGGVVGSKHTTTVLIDLSMRFSSWKKLTDFAHTINCGRVYHDSIQSGQSGFACKSSRSSSIPEVFHSNDSAHHYSL